MKKIFYLFILFFLILGCSKTNKNSLITGVINENFTRLPVDLAIAEFSDTHTKYVETYNSFSKLSKEVDKGYIDLAILPFPKIFELLDKKTPKISFLMPISKNSEKLIYYNNFDEKEIINNGKIGILKNTSLCFLLNKRKNSGMKIIKYHYYQKLIADFYHHKLDGIFIYPDKVFKIYGPYKISDFVENELPYFPNSGIVVNNKRYKEKKSQIDSLTFKIKQNINYIQDNPINTYKISQELYHYNIKITRNSLYSILFTNRFSTSDSDYFHYIISEMKKQNLLNKDFTLPDNFH